MAASILSAKAYNEPIKTSNVNLGALTGMPAYKSLLNNANVKKAILKCWAQAMNGLSETEYGFAALMGADDSYATLFSHSENQCRTTKITVFSETAAIFHTHPNSAPAEPSPMDKAVSHKINKPIFTITSRGIYCYSPDFNSTLKLQNYPDWMN